jgi:hypothetical protein
MPTSNLVQNNLVPRLDPTVWGPHFWFFLHTLGMSYPHYPNSVTKKKYYELVQNLPLFIPNEAIGSEFSKILDEYPVSAYLDSRESFIKWLHFIHNKINEKLEKPQISLNDFFIKYYDEYKTQNDKLTEYYKIKEKLVFFGIIFGITGIIYYLYDK